MSASGFPWINIPMVADTGEQQAFVQRREELAVLYRGLVEAGNADRGGDGGRHQRQSARRSARRQRAAS